MQTKTSKIKSVKYDGSYTDKYGIKHKHLIEFENGDKGHYNSVKEQQSYFVEGSEVQYEIDSKVNGNYTNWFVKPVKDEQQGFKKQEPRNQELIVAQSSMKTASDFHQRNPNASHEDLRQTAEFIYNWVMSKTTK